MHDISLTLTIIGGALVLFAWNGIPAIVVAIGASLALYFTGVLTMSEALTGFGDPVVILIASLLAIAVAVEVTGVGAWAGQWLLRRSGGNEKVLMVALMSVAAVFSGLIGMNGAVAAMVPVTVIIAVRTGKPPSLLMIPLALACLKGAKLTLLGSPVNVIAATQAETSGAGHFNFFAWALLGIPQLIGAILIVIWWGDKLLPVRQSESMPADFSGHAQTLAEHYDLEHGPEGPALLSRDSGLAEVVVPARSELIATTAFPGMMTPDHEVMVLAVRRGGAELVRPRLTLRAGDHLLLQGSWPALERYLAEAQVVAIDSPDTVRTQAVPLGRGAKRTIAIMALLVILLVFNITPAPIACALCACLVVATGVLRMPQVYRGLDWNTVLLIGAMIAPARAMEKSGAARMIGDHIVSWLGDWGPIAVMIGLFLAATIITQFISNTSTALVMMPIALASATDMSVSAMPMIMAVAMGASASFLTPFANGVSLTVYGPGGYRFGDYWRIGIPVLIWTLAVTVAVTPLVWPFHP
ncbi:MAG: SLC13 family permease [Nocardioides sp.]